MSERERCGHDPPIPWRYSSCIGCVFTQIEQMEREREADRAAIRDAVEIYLRLCWCGADKFPELNAKRIPTCPCSFRTKHAAAIQRAQDAKG